jgi:NADPH-dependent 2,4-dienoyl-CoA reductase/sulfur reductase-like enzyme
MPNSTPSLTAQSQAESNTQKHVVVVGAGPVGMMSALKLSQAGIPVTIIEKVKPPD